MSNARNSSKLVPNASGLIEATDFASGLDLDVAKIEMPAGVTLPAFYINRPNAVDSLGVGGYLSLLDQGSSDYNAYWHRGIGSPFNGSDSPTTWSKFRLIFRMRATGGDSTAHTMQVAGYFYASGWEGKGAQWVVNSSQPRGHSWAVSPWVNLSDMPGFGDVAGLGIKHVASTSNVSANIGTVHIQFI